MNRPTAPAPDPAEGWQDLAAPEVALDDLLGERAGGSVTGATGAVAPAAAADGAAARRSPQEELQDRVAALARIGPLPDPAATTEAERRIAALATPPGALGRLGALAATLAGIAGRCPAAVPVRPTVIVAAGDHGVHGWGVSPWPQTISATVARLVAEGRAGTSALAGAAGARTVVVDVGLATEVAAHPRLVSGRVVAGTGDALRSDACTRDQAVRAVLVGARVADAVLAAGGDLLAVGDVGIGNTTASAALIGVLTGQDAAVVTGRGSGIDDATLARKQEVVAALLRRAAGRDPVGLLAAIAGAEHAAIVGVLLAAAARRVPVVLDGVVTGAAALVAAELAPQVRGALVAGHRSPEPGAGVALQALGLDPLLDLQMRLGEGSGAVLAIPTVVGAARLLHQVATLEDVLA